jgi:NAD-dependent SIR2 family protein deacetylase
VSAALIARLSALPKKESAYIAYLVGAGMSLSETIDCYRQHAESCGKIAGSDPDRKFAFLVLAQAWSGLADQVATAVNLIPSPTLQPEP